MPWSLTIIAHPPVDILDAFDQEVLLVMRCHSEAHVRGDRRLFVALASSTFECENAATPKAEPYDSPASPKHTTTLFFVSLS